MWRRKRVVLILALAAVVCVLAAMVSMASDDELQRFKEYVQSYELVNEAVIRDYEQDAPKDGTRQAYFIDFDEDIVYKGSAKREVNFSGAAALDEIQSFYLYPFECIYADLKQVAYVYAEGFVSVVYVREGIFPKYDSPAVDTEVKWLGGRWFSVNIGN